MQFTLKKKIVVQKDKNGSIEKEFTNFYLVSGDVILPISIRVFKDKEGNILNKTDFVMAVKLAESLN